MPEVNKKENLFCTNCELQVWERPGVSGVYEDIDGFTVCVAPGTKHELPQSELAKFSLPRAVIGPWGTPLTDLPPTI